MQHHSLRFPPSIGDHSLSENYLRKGRLKMALWLAVVSCKTVQKIFECIKARFLTSTILIIHDALRIRIFLAKKTTLPGLINGYAYGKNSDSMIGAGGRPPWALCEETLVFIFPVFFHIK